ncbi:hypothetical protein RND71_034437 [Anisodus tanguticus]|uniref:Uncharacterized protein n=1 Tax=Anisodus tanguticus TaxID=243964 RepID=A0AAE1UX15_9SOLA|nr:hypothetical protein RND71_034437 [Anisodus tanguticus]
MFGVIGNYIGFEIVGTWCKSEIAVLRNLDFMFCNLTSMDSSNVFSDDGTSLPNDAALLPAFGPDRVEDNDMQTMLICLIVSVQAMSRSQRGSEAVESPLYSLGLVDISPLHFSTPPRPNLPHKLLQGFYHNIGLNPRGPKVVLPSGSP